MTDTLERTLLKAEAALAYAARGWHVLPLHEPLFNANGACTGCTCEAYERSEKNKRRLEAKGRGGEYNPNFVCPRPGKHPRGELVSNGVKHASTDASVIRRWWKRYPNANVGIACGASGLLALDADLYKDTFAGDLSEFDEETVTSLTGGGGTHLLYAMPEGATYGNSTGDLPEGIDIRGAGGYICAPPSLHPSGNRYQWEAGYGPEECAVAPMPEALRRRLDVSARPAGKEAGPPDSEAVARSVDLVQRVLQHGNMEHGKPENYGEGGQGRRIKLATCPFNPEGNKHADGATAVVLIDVDGTIRATCNHNRCQKRIGEVEGRGWQLLREIAGVPVVHVNGDGAVAPDVPWDDGFTTEPPSFSPGDKPAGKAKAQAKAQHTAASADEFRYSLRFAAESGGRFCHVEEWGWMEFTGTHWRKGAERAVRGAVARMLGAISAEYAIDNTHKPTQATPTAARVRGVMWLAESELGAPFEPFLTPPAHLLNTVSGVVDLRTGRTRPATSSDRFLWCAPTEYNPQTEPEDGVWLGLVSDWTAGAVEIADYLRLAAGYSFTGETRERCLFFLQGDDAAKGSNGKSTFLAAVTGALGEGITATLPLDAFTDRHAANDTQGFRFANLPPARMVIATEGDMKAFLKGNIIKTLTGGPDKMSSAHKGKDPIAWHPRFKMWPASNFPPKMSADDPAAWGRFRILRFNADYTGGKGRKDLPELLATDAMRRAILRWGVSGAVDWYARGLPTVEQIVEETKRAALANDPAARFAGELERTGQTQAKALHVQYVEWCEGEGVEPQTPTAFGRSMGRMGIEKARGAGGVFYKATARM